MEMNDLSCAQFLAQLASKAPTPGGGGTAALVGAAGVALGNMVGCLTTGKKKYAAVEAEIQALNARAECPAAGAGSAGTGRCRRLCAVGCGLRPAQGHPGADRAQGCCAGSRAGRCKRRAAADHGKVRRGHRAGWDSTPRRAACWRYRTQAAPPCCARPLCRPQA